MLSLFYVVAGISGNRNQTNKLEKINQLWTLTGGVVVSRHGFTVTIIAMVSKKGLVVIVFIPVERFDFEAASLRVPADDT